jgi:hypothetical protein
MKWIAAHQAELQALSGLVIAFLTIVLIVLTGFYVRANWRTVRLLEADLHFRTRPVRLVEAALGTSGMTTNMLFMATVKTSNAPLRLDEITIKLYFPSGRTESRTLTSHLGRVLNSNEEISLGEQFESNEVAENWNLTLVYYDLAGMQKYRTLYFKDNTSSTIATPAANSIFSRRAVIVAS